MTIGIARSSTSSSRKDGIRCTSLSRLQPKAEPAPISFDQADERRKAWGMLVASLGEEMTEAIDEVTQGEVESLLRTIRNEYYRPSPGIKGLLMRRLNQIALEDYRTSSDTAERFTCSPSALKAWVKLSQKACAFTISLRDSPTITKSPSSRSFPPARSIPGAKSSSSSSP